MTEWINEWTNELVKDSEKTAAMFYDSWRKICVLAWDLQKQSLRHK